MSRPNGLQLMAYARARIIRFPHGAHATTTRTDLMLRVTLLVALALLACTHDAAARARTDRDRIVDAIRKQAAPLAHQRVQVHVETLAIVGERAILTGE